MTDGEPTRKKGGRPRRHAPDAKRPTMAFRMGSDLHQKLIDASVGNERSLSEEIERRLENSFAYERSLEKQSANTSILLQRLSVACAMIENYHDKDGNRVGSQDWRNHEPTAVAIKKILNHLADDIALTPTPRGILAALTDDSREFQELLLMKGVAESLAKILTGQVDLPKPQFGELR